MINHANTKINLFSIVNYILLLSNLSFISRINGFSLNIKTKVNPNTNRAELIECAKSLDESLALGEKIGTYSEAGWSNRLGTVLTPVSLPGVYTADRPFLWNKIDVGGKMTVIQLQNPSNSKPSLWIHSPVALDESLIQALGTLGEVEHIVSPNYEHVKYAKQWSEYYTNAKVWGCPGLCERINDVNWFGEIPYDIRPPKDDNCMEDLPEGFWDVNELQPIHVNCEKNPFTGKPFFNEVIFYHTPSKSLLFTDLYWNYPGSSITNENLASSNEEEDYGEWELAPKVEKIPFGTTLWKFGMDVIYRPFYVNFMVRSMEEKRIYRGIVDYILNVWDVDVIVPAHGDVVRGKGLIRDVLIEHFEYNP